MKKIFSLFILLLPVLMVAQKSDHKIKVVIDGYHDSTLYLAYYYGNKVKLADTAVMSKTSTYVFNGSQHLTGGIYIVVSSKKSKLFEFVLNKKKNFTLKTDTVNYSMNLTASGSPENKLFYNYLKENEKIYAKVEELSDSLRTIGRDSDKGKEILVQMRELRDEGKVLKQDIIKKNRRTFVATLLTAMQEVKVPDSIINSPDSTAAFIYYKKHFWDNFPLNDERLLRTPLFDKHIKDYFKNLVALNADSVIVDIDRVIGMAEPSDDVVSYLVWYFTAEYQNPKYMGFDKILVHLVDNYFSKREIEYTTPSVLKSLQDRANTLRGLLIGTEAPNLILVDTTGNYQSFLTVPNKYTLLIFWDYNCSICKREIKALKAALKKNTKFDIGVFAINTNGDLEKWKKAIYEKGIANWMNVNGTRSVTQDFHNIYDINGTPVIYLLDANKKIIAKKLKAENVIPFLEHWEKSE